MLTDQQMADVRRFIGYSATGTTQPIGPTFDIVFVTFGMVEMSLYTRLTNLSSVEESILTTTFLTNLYTLETAIAGATANLDTDAAAVWTHNKNEVRDRIALFNYWALRLCAWLGVERPGPSLSLSQSGGSVSLVRG